MAWSNPYHDELLPAGRIEEKAHSAFLQQEELVGSFALVRYNGFLGKKAMSRRGKDQIDFMLL